MTHKSRHRLRPTRRGRIVLGIGTAALILVIACTTIFSLFASFDLGIHRSAIDDRPGKRSGSKETSILVMGLDSRRDENGDALPDEMYNALRAGDQSDGGYNANSLIFVHIPAHGRATAISIPRDDYAALAGAPDGVTHSKIKEAYGLALDQRETELIAAGTSRPEAYQAARAYARQVQVKTVSDFLGGVRIDHFVEVTMAAFYSVAKAVEPITVCLNHATEDRYSGANFAAGEQEITAEQAMSFVRQRRDTGPSDLELTDLDRARRQQAFILSLAHQLKSSRRLGDLGMWSSLLDASKKYVALDDTFDLADLVRRGNFLASGNIDFYTLPIAGFGVRDGKDVNLVDEDEVHSFVRNLLNPPTAQPQADATTTPHPEAPSASPQPADPRPDEPTNAPLPSGGVPCVN